jgi:hypothetical protein
MMRVRIFALALAASGFLAQDGRAQSVSFSDTVANAPIASEPFAGTDAVPIIQNVGGRNLTFKWLPQTGTLSMLPSAQNAVLPDALKGLGLLNSTGANTYLGLNAGSSITTGTGIIAIGTSALHGNTTGDHNTAVGWQALTLNTTGTNNVALGINALSSSVTGDENTAIGAFALGVANGASGNTALGQGSMQSTTSGNNNLAAGWGSLYNNTTGSFNAALGYYALYSATTAGENVAVGNGALSTTITGSENTAVGQGALNLATGAGNTAVGQTAGSALTTQTGVTILGRCSGVGASSNTVYLCDGAGVVTATLTASTLLTPSNLNVTGVITGGGNIVLPLSGEIHMTGDQGATTYALYGDASSTLMNVASGGTLGFRVNNSPVASMTAATTTFANVVDAVSGIKNNGVLLFSPTAPTLASGGCTTHGAITANGTAALNIQMTGTCSGSEPIVFTFPAAPRGWACGSRNITNAANFPKQTGALSTTSVTITNYDTTLTAAAWTTGDVVEVGPCVAY